MLGTDSAIKRTLSYRRFVGQRPLRVLCLTSGYHLQQEACRALVQLGHEAFELNIRVGGPAEVIRLLLRSMMRVRPDFLLLVNHIGFDDGGGVGNLLEWLNMPLAIWYVDSPFFVIKNLQFPAPTVSSVFLWERTLLAPLKEANVQDLYFLPLGTDPTHFAFQQASPTYPVSFVGNSMVLADKKWSGSLSGEGLKIANGWRRQLIEKRQPMVEHALEVEKTQPRLPAWSMLASATFSATGHYRRGLLAAIKRPALHIFGDASWPGILPRAHIHPQVPYGPQLADVYRRSAININATSLQMPTAVNQRAFDVPASGGFLLGDKQADFGEHFELGSEAIAYSCKEELASLVDFYTRHPALRASVVARGHARVQSSHCYTHRLAEVVSHLRRRHGPMRVANRSAVLVPAAPTVRAPC